ncbi:MAG TPA: beta-ketoacyl-ACP synthase III [Myxococcales bacterium]
MKAYINAAAAFLPNAPVANADIEKVLGQVGERPSVARTHVLKANGIKSRHYAIDPATGRATHSNAQMTAEAVRLLSKRAGFSLAKDLALLACGTATPDQLMPAHGAMVHGELQAPPCEVITCAGVCCASMAALKYAAMAVASGESPNAVVAGSELTSSLMRASHFQPELEEKLKKLATHPHLAFEHDFLRWMLSDGAGAILLEPEPVQRAGTPPLRIEWIDYVSFAGEIETCMYHGAVKEEDGRLTGWKEIEDGHELQRRGFFNMGQDARLLNKNIGRLMREGLSRSVARHGLDPKSVGWMLPHFSSYYFATEMRSRLAELGFAIGEDRVFTNLAQKGNTGAASIFIILDELLASGRLRGGDKLLCFVPESGRFSVSYMLLTVCG